MTRTGWTGGQEAGLPNPAFSPPPYLFTLPLSGKTSLFLTRCSVPASVPTGFPRPLPKVMFHGVRTTVIADPGTAEREPPPGGSGRASRRRNPATRGRPHRLVPATARPAEHRRRDLAAVPRRGARAQRGRVLHPVSRHRRADLGGAGPVPRAGDAAPQTGRVDLQPAAGRAAPRALHRGADPGPLPTACLQLGLGPAHRSLRRRAPGGAQGVPRRRGPLESPARAGRRQPAVCWSAPPSAPCSSAPPTA